MKLLCLRIGIVLVIWVCSACTGLSTTISQVQAGARWVYSDLRRLDPDDAPDPTRDLLAVYTRQSQGVIEIRLDLLDSGQFPDFDLYIPIDYQPGGLNSLPIDSQSTLSWDILLQVTAQQGILVHRYDPVRGEIFTDQVAGVVVIRDPSLDTLTIRTQRLMGEDETVNRLVELTPREDQFQFEVYLTASGASSTLDHIPPVQTNSPPPEPAPTLMAFWNTYPAYTPALALRRWDGAHTGPEGGRHGLYNLLRTARSADIPIFLLDLNYPQGLSALEFSGQTDLLRDMAADGAVSLSAALPTSLTMPSAPKPVLMEHFKNEIKAQDENLAMPRPVSIFAPYGLEALGSWIERGGKLTGDLVFIPSQTLVDQAGTEGLGLTAMKSVTRWGSLRVIPIPGYNQPAQLPEQATRDGPSLDLKRTIIRSALSANDHAGSDSILILGGDLPASTWGIPQSARATFGYLASRPWIHFLDLADLVAFPLPTSPGSIQSQALLPESGPRENELYQALIIAPENELTAAAWQYWQSLYAPIYPYWDKTIQLRASYLDQVGSLLSAANWAQNLQSISSCSIDTDDDGENDCVLANDHYYLIFGAKDSILRYAFYMDPLDRLHQVIGPSSQVITGLSDPSLAPPGSSNDPSVIRGAFIESQTPDGRLVNDKELIFYWESGGIENKIYRLTDDGISVEYHLRDENAPQFRGIPLLVDPWQRFSRDWSQYYSVSEGDDSVRWHLKDSIVTQVRANGQPQLTSFLESKEYMDQPEDPNRDYPPGHYLPFPIALVEVPIANRSPVVITIFTDDHHPNSDQ